MNGSQVGIYCCLPRDCTPECNTSNFMDLRAQTSPQSYPTDVLEKAHTFPYEHLCGVSIARIDLVDEEFLTMMHIQERQLSWELCGHYWKRFANFSMPGLLFWDPCRSDLWCCTSILEPHVFGLLLAIENSQSQGSCVKYGLQS